MLGFVSYGQTASVEATKTSKKQCVPTQECADKMGMTLEECKALCAKVCGSKAASTVASATKLSELAPDKVACGSKTEVSNTTESSVASAIVSSDVADKAADSPASKEKVCAKSSKACCKKIK